MSIQRHRYKKDALNFNAQLEPKMLDKYCVLDKEGEELFNVVVFKIGLSARVYDKILKGARIIADLDGKERIEAVHISEAIGYCSLDAISRLKEKTDLGFLN